MANLPRPRLIQAVRSGRQLLSAPRPRDRKIQQNVGSFRVCGGLGRHRRRDFLGPSAQSFLRDFDRRER